MEERKRARQNVTWEREINASWKRISVMRCIVCPARPCSCLSPLQCQFLEKSTACCSLHNLILTITFQLVVLAHFHEEQAWSRLETSSTSTLQGSFLAARYVRQALPHLVSDCGVVKDQLSSLPVYSSHWSMLRFYQHSRPPSTQLIHARA